MNREHMGEYTCVADNGIPPRASKKFKLQVRCKYIHKVLTIIFMIMLIKQIIYLLKSHKVLFKF